MARPEESLQPVVLASGDDMDVKMRDALANPIVHGDEAPFPGHSLLRCACEKTGTAEERGNKSIGQIRQRDLIGPRESDRALHGVLEFAHVTRPVVFDQTLDDIGVEAEIDVRWDAEGNLVSPFV